MLPLRSYPVLATSSVAATSGLYRSMFGLVPRFVTNWFVYLEHPTDPSVALAVVEMGHHSVPEECRVPGAGVIITFEVDDVDLEYERLVQRGVDVVVSLRDEPWGQRHFIVRGHDGVMIDVVTLIEPTMDYLAAYAGERP